jgi:hypothetical protein
MSVGFRLLSSLPFALAAMLFSMCSEPAPPEVVPPITQPDTTTHEYTWEYHVFGQSPVSTSWFRDIHIVNDDNFWMVGDVQIDTIIYTRSGLSTQRVTAVHWDGKKFTPYAIEGLTISGQVSGVAIYAVEGREGSVYFMSNGACTEMRDDSVAIHDLRVLAGKWSSHQRMDKFRSDRMYIYGGGPGFAAELVQERPLGPMTIRQIPVNSELPVATFAEAATDDYYMGLWWTKSSEHHFWRRLNGELIDYNFSRTELGQRDFCAALWVSNEYVYSTSGPYMFRQAISDTTDRVFTFIMANEGEVKPLGMPFRMTGSADNDIFIAGDYGTVFHYNGVSFHLYKECKEFIPTGRFFDIAVTKHKVYLVGGGSVDGKPRAVLMIGTRR